MKHLVSKNKALEVTKLKERELNVIVSKHPDEVATYDSNRSLDKIKLDGVVEILKDDKMRLELGLVTPLEVQSLLIEMGLFKVDPQYPNRLSDFINKAARDKKISFVNTTISHAEDKKRKLRHKLFRSEECRDYIKSTFLTPKEPKKETVVKSSSTDSQTVNKSENNLSDQIIQMEKTINFQTERTNKLELLVESLQGENKKRDKLIEELQVANEIMVGELSSVQRYVGNQTKNKEVKSQTSSSNSSTSSSRLIPVDDRVKKLLKIATQDLDAFGFSPAQRGTIVTASNIVFDRGGDHIGLAAAGILRDMVEPNIL